MIIQRFRQTTFLSYVKTSLNVLRGFFLAKIIIVFLGSESYGLWMSLLGTLSLSSILSIANYQALGNELNIAIHRGQSVIPLYKAAKSNLVFGIVLNVLVSLIFLYFIPLERLNIFVFLVLVMAHTLYLYSYRFLIRVYEPSGQIIKKVRLELSAELLEIIGLALAVYVAESLTFLLLSLCIVKVVNHLVVLKSLQYNTLDLSGLDINHLKPRASILSILLGEKLFAEGFSWVLTFSSSFIFISSFTLYRSFINLGVMLSITYLMIVLPKIQEQSLKMVNRNYENELLKSYFICLGILFLVVLNIRYTGNYVMAYFVNSGSLNGQESLICLFGFVIGTQTAITQVQKVLPSPRYIVLTVSLRLSAIIFSLNARDIDTLLWSVISAEILGVLGYLYFEKISLIAKLKMGSIFLFMSFVVWAI